MKNSLISIGKTKDNKIVVKNLFYFFDTTGLPLTDIWQSCINKNIMPSWIDFYNEASIAGWKHKTIITRLRESINDAYGSEFQKIVINNLEKMFGD